MVTSLPITCAPTWVTTSGMTGFTLPGMIDEPGCKIGKSDLGEPGARAAAHPPQVVGDLDERDGEPAQLPAGLHQRVARALRREVILRLDKRQPGALREPRDHLAGETLRCVDAGTDRGAAERQHAQPRQRVAAAARSPSSTCVA